MKRRTMRIVALLVAISVMIVQVDSVSVNAVVNAPVVTQEYPQIQNVGFVADWVASLGISAGRLVAFAFVLTLLGFVVENGISNAWENREEYLSYLTNLKQNFLDYCSESKEWCSIKANEFDLWLDMIAQGTLDKSSKCWQAIKDYCVDLKARIDSSSSAVDDSDVIKVENVSGWLDAVNINSSRIGIKQNQVAQTFTSYNLAEFGDTYILSEKSKFVCIKVSNANFLMAINPSWKAGLNIYSNCGFMQDVGASTGIARPVYYYGGSDGIPAYCGNVYYTNYAVIDRALTDANVTTYEIDYTIPTSVSADIYAPKLLALATGLMNGFDDWAIEIPKDDGIAEDVTQGLTVAGGTSGVIERDGSLDNVDVVGVSGAKDDAIAIDWDNVSVEDLSNPYPYDDIKTVDLVDGVIVGTDTPIDEVVPPTDGTDTSTDRNNYTLSGLTELFPFCIPFDLVMLFQVLKADAKAPCFTWKFVYYTGSKKHTEDIIIDLSKFNTVAEVLRMMELLAFMVALTIKTRDLIRG